MGGSKLRGRKGPSVGKVNGANTRLNSDRLPVRVSQPKKNRDRSAKKPSLGKVAERTEKKEIIRWAKSSSHTGRTY